MVSNTSGTRGCTVCRTSALPNAFHNVSVRLRPGRVLENAGTLTVTNRFGDAFDLPLSFYTAKYETLACTDGFKFAYLESGTHLHVDQNPAYATCMKE